VLRRSNSALLGTAVLAAALVATAMLAGSGRSAISGASRAAADCSVAAATQLVEQHQLNSFLLPNPVRQVLCGSFTGPGSEAMAVTIGAPTCWPIQRWAVFRFTGSSWELVLDQSTFLNPPLVAVGSDIQETAPLHRSGDARCLPSGGTRARLWHWDGNRLVAGPWRQVTPGEPQPRKPVVFRSPSGNIRCALWAKDDKPVADCWSVTTPKSVRMDAAGRLRICRGARCIGADCGCIEGFDYPRLAYGRSITLAPFRCASLRTGIRCTVIRTGKGFLIDRAAIRRLG
jgi:hypothetical protein